MPFRRTPIPRSLSRRLTALVKTILLCGLLLQCSGCASSAHRRNPLAYTPQEFQTAIAERVPEIGARLTEPPFAIDPLVVERAREAIESAPLGMARVEALLSFLTDPEPHGLGLSYNWAVTSGARRTLELRQGNCFSLASVLVGLGRGIGWPIYYAEARPRRPETIEFEEVTAVSDHMVVLVLAKTVRMIIDFTGEVEPDAFDIRPIDDLTAYAHLLNNVAGQSLMISEAPDQDPDWEKAAAGFLLATRIKPELGRAWNNLGIVYSRLGRFDEAREAYGRALALDTAFGSAERNLSLMETRQLSEPAIIPSGPIE